MKHLFSILLSVMFITSCNNEEHFASLAEDTLAESSENPDYNQEIKELVVDEVEVKISGKKRQTVDVVDTVGEKDLKQEEQLVTHIDVTSDVVVKEQEVTKEETTTVTTEVKVTEETTVKTEVKVTEETVVPDLNILLYIDNNSYGSCSTHLKRNHKAFLQALSAYNWSISFAYYADPGDSSLMALENTNGTPYDTDKRFFKFKKDYTLSKQEYSAKKASRLFYSTLDPNVSHAENLSSYPEPLKYSDNPLGGLSEILSSSAKTESRTVVLFFGDQFPYYSKAEWHNFYGKHPNVSLVALSYRSANVSNLLHVLEKENYDFSYIAGCGKDATAIVSGAGLKTEVLSNSGLTKEEKTEKGFWKRFWSKMMEVPTNPKTGKQYASWKEYHEIKREEQLRNSK